MPRPCHPPAFLLPAVKGVKGAWRRISEYKRGSSICIQSLSPKSTLMCCDNGCVIVYCSPLFSLRAFKLCDTGDFGRFPALDSSHIVTSVPCETKCIVGSWNCKQNNRHPIALVLARSTDPSVWHCGPISSTRTIGFFSRLLPFFGKWPSANGMSG